MGETLVIQTSATVGTHSTYCNGSFIHRTIFSRISQKVAFHENIIVNSYGRVAFI